MLLKFRRLCDALSVPCDAEKFDRLVKAAVRLRQSLLRPANADVDNRTVWPLLLAKSKDYHWALPVIQFYVAHPDGTSDVERGLGEHARFRDSHQGAPDGPDLSATEMCLEIRKEGLQTASALFTQGADGVLLLTDFSRELATLWLERHGRRFACAKPRCDRGKRNTGWGSLKAVAQLQKSATTTLVAQAARDGGPEAASRRRTIVGTRLAELMRKVAQTDAPKASKKILNFRKTTAQRIEQKTKVASWPGFAPTLPVLRRKPGQTKGQLLGTPASASSAPATDARAMARRAVLWSVSRRASAKARAATPSTTARAPTAYPMLVVCDRPSSGEPAPKYRKVSASAAARAKSIMVPSHDDLQKADANSDLLMTWMNIVAYGKSVHARDSSEKIVEYKAAVQTVPAVIALSNRFSTKHGHFAKALKSICQSKGSLWRLGRADEKNATSIDDTEALRKKLLSLQRFPHIAGIDCKYASGPTTKLTRFGNVAPARVPKPDLACAATPGLVGCVG